ncbi:MAG: ComEC/Rec2 family competence protein [Candidatus Odinarchaeota archaeon]
MPYNAILQDAETLIIHFLNVGHGDTVIIELPEVEGKRPCIVVDCYLADKTIDYLKVLGVDSLRLVVATHPHDDHIKGLEKLMKEFPVDQFWDSGFRHNTVTWLSLMNFIETSNKIKFTRPTAGLETFIAGVKITVLAPSISLRNRYDTYGVNINNASIVLKLEHKEGTVILTGDAQWDSWSKITEDFPHFEETANPDQKIKVSKGLNPLKCNILKISHHGSKRGTSFEYIERLRPNHAVISCGTRFSMPDEITESILREPKNIKIIETRNGSVVYTVKESVKIYQGDDNDPKDIPQNFNSI